MKEYVGEFKNVNQFIEARTVEPSEVIGGRSLNIYAIILVGGRINLFRRRVAA